MLQSSQLLTKYEGLDTPFLIVNKQKVLTNLNRLRKKVEGLGADLRPHFKTMRALEAASYLLPEKTSPITVSTMKEAEALASEGYSNIIYGVGISAAKLPRVLTLISKGIDIIVILDSMEQAHLLNQFSKDNQCVIPALIEIDCDGHRGGIEPEDPILLEIASVLYHGLAHLKGILTHAGESYYCYDQMSLRVAAENEVKAALRAAKSIRSADMPCEIVSIGSTPTAHNYQNLEGITEVRAGVYGFFDLVMTGVGVCSVDDIAANVVTTVIGHNKEKGWLIVDAGWMALSSDRGTAKQPKDCGYGLLANNKGLLLEGLQVTSVNQEHGIVAAINGASINFDEIPIGSRLHIMPNHACATTSMHKQYHVFDTQDATYEVWNRIQGW